VSSPWTQENEFIEDFTLSVITVAIRVLGKRLHLVTKTVRPPRNTYSYGGIFPVGESMLVTAEVVRNLSSLNQSAITLDL